MRVTPDKALCQILAEKYQTDERRMQFRARNSLKLYVQALLVLHDFLWSSKTSEQAMKERERQTDRQRERERDGNCF